MTWFLLRLLSGMDKTHWMFQIVSPYKDVYCTAGPFKSYDLARQVGVPVLKAFKRKGKKALSGY